MMDPTVYRDIFEHDARGASILEDLHSRFGVVRVVTTGGIDAVLKTYKSAAHAEVIGFILNRIAQANGQSPINPEGEMSSE